MNSRFRDKTPQIVVIGLILLSISGCGGGSAPPPPNNPVPTITTITPSSVAPDGPAFTLSVSGKDFVNGATVNWNGSARSSTFVSTSSVTAQISGDDIVPSGDNAVTVVNPGPGGGASNMLNLNVPCTLAPETAVSKQTNARLGAIYFDGWSSTLSNFHFNGMVGGPYQNRQPLSGWFDNTPCSVERQLAWAHSFGVDFFLFDTYYKPEINYQENLNNALQIMTSLPDRHGVQFAILDADPLISMSDWNAAVESWVSYFSDPDYLRVNGKPLLMILSFGMLEGQFGSPAGAAGALAAIRQSVQAHGFPGVYLVAGLTLPLGISGQDAQYPDLSFVQTEGYDAISVYNYPYIVPSFDGMLPFSQLADTGKWMAVQNVKHSALPYISTAMAGWDPRPWGETDPQTGAMMWFDRSPQDVANLVSDMITWAESNPKFRAEPSPTAPLVLIEAWNEFGEGSHFLPTVGDGTTYGDALSQMLAIPATRARTVMSVQDNGPTAPNRTAAGTVTDANGSAIAGAPVTITAIPADGNGVYAQYPISGVAPANATQVIAAYSINTDGYGPGASNVSVYQVSYFQSGDGLERVANGDFSLGAQGWSLFGQTQIVASDRGSGQMAEAIVSNAQTAGLSSAPFTITGGTPFQASFAARISPSSVGSGYFTIIFLDNGGNEISRQIQAFEVGTLQIGAGITDGAGSYQVSLSALGTAKALIEASYDRDATHWPGYSRVGP